MCSQAFLRIPVGSPGAAFGNALLAGTEAGGAEARFAHRNFWQGDSLGLRTAAARRHMASGAFLKRIHHSKEDFSKV